MTSFYHIIKTPAFIYNLISKQHIPQKCFKTDSSYACQAVEPTKM